MKTREEIEKLANEEYKDNLHNPFFTAAPMGYIKGYTKCQEDMQKDVEYWQGEFDHWHQQAMEMSKYKYTEEDMQEYAEFCIRCYEKKLPCIIAKDWFEQFKKKQD
jgi:hypothetical protein